MQKIKQEESYISHIFPTNAAPIIEGMREIMPVYCVIGKIPAAKKGWFSPLFQTEKEQRDILQKLYKETDLHVDGSMVYFCCVK